MDKLSKEQVLASSSGWVASLLNFLPGVGAGYLSDIFLGQDSLMMNNFIYVIFPVLSITVLMFSLRIIVQDFYTPKVKKQR